MCTIVMTISDSEHCDNVNVHLAVLKPSAHMPLELNAETVMPLSAAARLVPPIRGNKPPHYLTLVRWATKGIRSFGDERIVLETFFCGATRVTTAAAIVRFFERITAASEFGLPSRKRTSRKAKRR
jgi:hypothetical protein